MSSDITIIGAGLSGLALAYYLRNSGKTVRIVEARNRIGGRIETIYEKEHHPLELGATWLGSKHQALRSLLEDLNLDVFEQLIGDVAIYEAISTSPPILAQLPPNPDPSMRIKGGSMALIQALHDQKGDAKVMLNSPINSIVSKADILLVKGDDFEIESKSVVSTLPPHLLIKTIRTQPTLPDELIDIASNTQTWMGESIKVGLSFEEPFWKSDQSSGTIFSNVGPVPEMYDHGNPEGDYNSLMGFLNGAYYPLTREERLDKILAQLEKYYGPKVRAKKAYYEKVWRLEKYTHTDYEDHILPHQNNGHKIYRKPFMNGRLYVGGTETASIHPGYMDGAIVNASSIARSLQEDNR